MNWQHLPCYSFVGDSQQEDQNGYGVEEAVSNERPPIQVDDNAGA